MNAEIIINITKNKGTVCAADLKNAGIDKYT